MLLHTGHSGLGGDSYGRARSGPSRKKSPELQLIQASLFLQAENVLTRP